jgi:hypothetical protein
MTRSKTKETAVSILLWAVQCPVFQQGDKNTVNPRYNSHGYNGQNLRCVKL